jgi:hypothetical protein
MSSKKNPALLQSIIDSCIYDNDVKNVVILFNKYKINKKNISLRVFKSIAKYKANDILEYLISNGFTMKKRHIEILCEHGYLEKIDMSIAFKIDTKTTNLILSSAIIHNNIDFLNGCIDAIRIQNNCLPHWDNILKIAIQYENVEAFKIILEQAGTSIKGFIPISHYDSNIFYHSTTEFIPLLNELYFKYGGFLLAMDSLIRLYWDTSDIKIKIPPLSAFKLFLEDAFKTKFDNISDALHFFINLKNSHNSNFCFALSEIKDDIKTLFNN